MRKKDYHPFSLSDDNIHIEMVTRLGNRNLETYMDANNIWHTQQMRVEDAMETELNR